MKAGFACGVFDLYHAGHARMLKECREQCDYLIVGLNSARSLKQEAISAHKNLPVMSIEERVEVMESIRWVDEVQVYHSEAGLEALLRDPRIAIRFLGEDYRGRPITGGELGHTLYYINRDHGYSTSGLIRRVLERHGGAGHS